MRDVSPRIVLVTGGSGGTGAEVARQLASTGSHVVVHHHRTAERADALVASIRSAGGQASSVAADIADAAETAAMIDSIRTRLGRLDTLVLNASGGLETGADPGYAMRLNRDAQRRLAMLALPLMPVGGRIVFVTNHQAHFFPNKAVPKGYAAVAASKRAGETALYAARAELHHAGVHLTVVSGEINDGTGLAASIAGAADTSHPTGIVYVGSADYLMTAA